MAAFDKHMSISKLMTLPNHSLIREFVAYSIVVTIHRFVIAVQLSFSLVLLFRTAFVQSLPSPTNELIIKS